jgi:sulfatase maturation enzyme AslB (radical SAM superfamily)
MNEVIENNGAGLLGNDVIPSDVPILRSFVVLRREYFGGYLFNPYIPPEIKLDPIRFRIATLCDGRHSLMEIKKSLGAGLNHTREYIDLLVESTIQSFNKCLAVFWRQEKIESRQGIRLLENDGAGLSGHRQLSAPLFAIWEITKKCNLRCKHCLSDSGQRCPDELTTREAKKVIDALEANKVFNVSLSGGEPLIRPDIFELLEYSSEKKIGVELLTNGTLITKETVDRLKNINLFNVELSGR